MINELKKLIKDNDGKVGNYGIERETLRVDDEGQLSFEVHPKELGDKESNPYITTDFSESQIEVITPVFQDIEETYDFLNLLYDTVAVNIGDEYLWPQSMPCIIPHNIPVAEFAEEKEATKYREKLLEKYGGKKQLISGVHYNFSFDEKIINGLYEESSKELSYKDFKNNLYLKVTRNYLRYRWLLIYLLGSTTTLHESFIDSCACIKCFKEVAKDSYSHEGGMSYRNGECGYRNLVNLFPDYSSVDTYVNSLRNFIEKGVIDSHKELYSQIRLKPSNPKNFLESLHDEGIRYLEYRTIDVNPFERSGVALEDLKFIEGFNLFLLLKEESNYKLWQEEALENQDNVSKFGKKNINLKRDGQYVNKTQWALEIVAEVEKISKELQIDNEGVFKDINRRIKNSDLTYAHIIEDRVKKMGYINAYISLAKEYKKQAYDYHENGMSYNKLKIKDREKIVDKIRNGEKFVEIFTLFDK